MAIFGNFKGTTTSEFKIGKGTGNKIITGEISNASSVDAGDIFIDSGNSTIQIYNGNVWQSVGSTLTDLNVDTGTLIVNSANDTVSIGSTSSNDKLFVNGSLRLGTNPAIKYSGAYLDVNHANGTGTVVRVRDNTGNTDPVFKVYSANNTSEVFKVQGGTTTVTGNIIPSANVTYNLGSDASRWKDLFLSGSTITLGTTSISINADNEVDFTDSANSSIKRKLVVDEIHLGDGDDAVVLKKGSDGRFQSKTQNRSSKAESTNKVDLDDNNSDDLSEGSTNLYFTNARADARVNAVLATQDSDDIKEGSTNLYYTDARANSAIDAKLTGDITLGNVTSQSVSSGVVSGVVFEPITDYGSVTSTANMTIDYGSIRASATNGDFEYLLDTFGPTGDSYTVATVPSAAQPGQMIFVSNETGGATMAFSDGTNWRRITDRAVISS